MNGVSNKKAERKKAPKTRQSLLTSNNVKWQALSEDSQNLFLSEFDSILREVRYESANWFRPLVYIGCNEVLHNIDNICGVVIHQRLFNLGIGNHILVLCGINEVPCVILSKHEEISKWYPNPNLSFCFGLRKGVDETRLGKLKTKITIQNCESLRVKLEELINKSKSSFEIPYLIPSHNFEDNTVKVKLLPPLIRSRIVEPKIEYPKYMKRKERKKLRKERRKNGFIQTL
ncbi:hypothetical protein FG386_003601 [Cryptosporidium ryanae]|uniref:uncharacterized protein n=1 Tax=Cryptosporidium ryanae TaxID=515981 RepID=UPI00351A2454|nr:hypothetical protein FG386_003601 [Cryptosporidium ryanae]